MRSPRLAKAGRGTGLAKTLSTTTAMRPLLGVAHIRRGGGSTGLLLPRVLLKLAEERNDIDQRRVVERAIPAARGHQHAHDAPGIRRRAALLEKPHQLVIALRGDELAIAQVCALARHPVASRPVTRRAVRRVDHLPKRRRVARALAPVADRR